MYWVGTLMGASYCCKIVTCTKSLPISSATHEAWLGIFFDSRKAFRATMYITKILEFSSNAALMNFFLLMSFIGLVVDKALAEV